MILAALAWALFWHFFLFSLMGIGGFMVTVPEVYRWLVTDSGLLSPDAFRSAIALGQASPGPNSLIVWVLGWFVAGPLGALCALLGYTIPFSILFGQAGNVPNDPMHFHLSKTTSSGIFHYFQKNLFGKAGNDPNDPVNLF